jgi:hypothetical protein
MLSTEYLLNRQKDLIDKQSDMIKDLKAELESKDEIIAMLQRINELDSQIAELKIQSILTPSMN